MNFAPARGRILSGVNVGMIVLALAGVAALVARFALGLGRSTNLSDTWPWGLWIAFDLIWIALAAGAFVMAGVIYVLNRKKYYEIGRSAVLIGLLSYSFVMVTLVADLGLPWHFWQLAVQRPEHSAMFEVSWCVGLYVTVLAFEFAPVLFERLRLNALARFWRIHAPIYVVFAICFFVYLMSQSIVWTLIACVVFSSLAFALRPREGEPAKPVMLAIAAFTLSTMHQSSLGTLFLLMPDKLSPIWWTPLLPLLFFLSAIAAGLALVTVIQMIVAASYRRPIGPPIIAGLARYLAVALIVYLAVRIGDLAARQQLNHALANPLFLIEVGMGGLVPIAVLLVKQLRLHAVSRILACVLTAGGIILNRLNVVIFAMEPRGPMPGTAPTSYAPSLVEIGVTVGLIAATIFLYNLGVHTLPVLKARDAE